MAYAPLGRGFLTGVVPHGDALPQNDRRRDMPRFQGANAQSNQKLVTMLKELAAQERCTPAQLAMTKVTRVVTSRNRIPLLKLFMSALPPFLFLLTLGLWNGRGCEKLRVPSMTKQIFYGIITL